MDPTWVNADVEFRNKKRFQYGIPAHFEHCLYLFYFHIHSLLMTRTHCTASALYTGDIRFEFYSVHRFSMGLQYTSSYGAAFPWTNHTRYVTNWYSRYLPMLYHFQWLFSITWDVRVKVKLSRYNHAGVKGERMYVSSTYS
jgi:hypothetical protein